MITMDGTHTFELDAHYLYKDSRAMGMKIVVTYDVDVWRNGSEVDMGKVTPATVVIVAGGFELPMVDYSETHGALAAFIEIESAKLGLEGLGITDEEARDWIAAVEDEEVFRREHAAGRV